MDSLSFTGTHMNYSSLIDLLPQPIVVCRKDFTGTLTVKGSIEQNCISFVFQFKTDTPIPLKITIHNGTEEFCCRCVIVNQQLKTVTSPLFSPKFNIGQPLNIVAIQSLIS